MSITKNHKLLTNTFSKEELRINKIIGNSKLFEDATILDAGFGGCHELRIRHISTQLSKRGKGHASRALKWLCNLADKEHLNITLCPVVMNSGGLNHSQLVLWYRRHGFICYGEEEEEMIRYWKGKI